MIVVSLLTLKCYFPNQTEELSLQMCRIWMTKAFNLQPRGKVRLYLLSGLCSKVKALPQLFREPVGLRFELELVYFSLKLIA